MTGPESGNARQAAVGRTFRCDLHIHTAFSHDGSGSVEECCRNAVALGLSVIGFSEHVDFDPADPGYGCFRYEDIASAVCRARELYGSDLIVLLGVEVDYQAWFEEDIAAFLQSHPFDYKIGSVHAIGGKTLMSDEYLAQRRGANAYADYYDAVRRSAESGLFDIIGHFGYAMRRGLRKVGPPDAEAREMEQRALYATAASGACLEVNGAGLRHGIGSTYPPLGVLERYREQGGELVSIGSDAHRPADVGRGVAEAEQSVRSAGLRVLVPGCPKLEV